MKNKFIKYYIVVFYLCSICVLFAQPGTGTTTTIVEDNLEAADAQPAPIDSYIWVMMGIGIVFVFFKYKVIRNQKRIF